MSVIRNIIDRKPSSQVWSVRPEDTVFTALKLMAEKDVGALLVKKGMLIVGIFSERDYARRVFLKDRSSPNTRVEEVMTRDVFFVEPECTAEECMAIMTDKKVRHFPVMEQGDLVGLVSMGDIIKDQLGEKQFMIDQLVRYITGSPVQDKDQRPIEL